MVDPRPVADDIDELLARAVEGARSLAADDILPPELVPTRSDDSGGAPTRDELRRLTVMFTDFVGSTPLSSRLDPETYRGVLAEYRDICLEVIQEQFQGRVAHIRGDGLLAVFGYPTAHEDDALRAAKAGLEIQRRLLVAPSVIASGAAEPGRSARVGVHRGLVYIERDTDELFGFAVNVASRIQESAEPGTVVISDEVRRLVDTALDVEELPRVELKGVEEAPLLHRVIGERAHPAGSRRWSTPIVGRDDEGQVIRSSHAAASESDRPLALLVVGDAGVGKTRLVSSFLDELPRATRVIEMGASPFHRHHGLHPFRELLHDVAGLRNEHDATRQLEALRRYLAGSGLEGHLSVLAPVAGLNPEAGYEPLAVEARLLEERVGHAVHEVLLHHAGAGSVLFVEDLHWLDDASLAVLDRFIQSGPANTFVAMTSRTSRPVGGYATTVLALEPLDDHACLTLARHHDSSLTDEMAAELIARSDGIPLFVEELVRARDEPVIRPAGDRDAASSVPEPLYQALCSRLTAMDDTRLVVSAAATIGRVVNLDVLARVSAIPLEKLEQVMTRLIEQQVVEPDHGDGRAVRFRHELVREVAYELEPPSGRERLHALVANALAETALDSMINWALIGEHHRRGGQLHSAVAAFENAAIDARQRGSTGEARDNFSLALDVLAEIPHDQARDRREVGLLLARAFLSVTTEGFASTIAAEDYRRCLELCASDSTSEELYQTLIALWGWYINRSDLDRAWAVSTALRPMSVGYRAGMLPTNLAGFGMISFFRGEIGHAAEVLEQACRDIHLIGVDESSAPATWTMPVDPVASMHMFLGLARAAQGDVAGAQEQAALAQERCARLPFPSGPLTATYCLLVETWVHLDLGDIEMARDHIVKAASMSEQHGFDAWLFWSSIMGPLVLAWGQPPADARAASDGALGLISMWDIMGARLFTPMLHGSAARMLLASGDREGAAAAAQASLDAAAATGSVVHTLLARRVLALAGPPDDAVERLVGVYEDAMKTEAVLEALRAATALVERGGPEHSSRLEAVLDRLPPGADHPIFDEARALLART